MLHWNSSLAACFVPQPVKLSLEELGSLVNNFEADDELDFMRGVSHGLLLGVKKELLPF